MHLRTKILLLAAAPVVAVSVLAAAGVLASMPGAILVATAALAVVWIGAGQIARAPQGLLAQARALTGLPVADDGGDELRALGPCLGAIGDRLDQQRTRLGALATALAETRAAAESAATARRAFLAAVGHELRTPIHAIIGMTRLALSTDLPAKPRDHLERVDRAAHALLARIGDIVDYIRGEAGELCLSVEPYSLDDVLAEVTAGSADRAAAKGLTVRLERDPSVPAQLAGDPRRLAQVLGALVAHSVDATGQGKVTVACRLTGAELELEVRDTGPGLTPEQQAALFEPFPCAAQASCRYVGSALDLGLSQRLVAAMGGRLEVDSSPGSGSRFWFRLPFAPAGVTLAVDRRVHPSASPEASTAAERRPASEHSAAAHLDLDTARRLLGGDEDLLSRLLARFRRDHGTFINDYRALHAAGDRFGACQLARELASAADSLGATALKETAAWLMLKRRAEDDPGPELALAARQLATLFAEIEVRLAEVMAPGVPAAGAQADIGAAIDRLADLLSAFDAAAINSFERLRPRLAGLGQGRLLDALQRDLNGFDFVPALNKLRQLARDAGVAPAAVG